MVVLGDYLYVVGGLGGDKTVLSSVERYSIIEVIGVLLFSLSLFVCLFLYWIYIMSVSSWLAVLWWHLLSVCFSLCWLAGCTYVCLALLSLCWLAS